MWALIGLVTLTFDLLPSKLVHWLLVWWTSILPILVFLGLSVLELGRGTRQTDRRTGRHQRSFYNAPSPTGAGHNNALHSKPTNTIHARPHRHCNAIDHETSTVPRILSFRGEQIMMKRSIKLHCTESTTHAQQFLTCTSNVKYFLRFLMIMTRNGSLIPSVWPGSAGHVMYVVLHTQHHTIQFNSELCAVS